MLTNELALVTRKLFKQYKCTDLVIDAGGVGSGVFDLLVQDIVDPETGELLNALSCCNNKEMAERCKVDNAPKVIWAIKASSSFNTEICMLLRNGFQNRKINLLVSEFECEEILKDKVRNFKNTNPDEQVKYKMPYINTTLLVYELINLDHEINGTNIKIIEKTGARKDRYSSLAYNYWVQCQLERENLRVKKSKFDMNDYAKQLNLLNKRPNMY